MQYFVFFASLILAPLMLCLIDRRIKGARSVFMKFLSMVLVTGFVFLGVYFYGHQILATFKINTKSLTSMKAFVDSRMLMYFIFLILILFVVFKYIFVTVVFKNTFRTTTKTEKTITLLTVFFDLALIPNILVNNSLVALFVATSLIEIGLVYIKLVFSITFPQAKEVLA